MTTAEQPQVSPVAKIEALYARLTKARQLVADGKVHPIYGLPNHYVVEGNDAQYLVNGEPCLCPDSIHRPELKHLCKHRLGVELYKEANPAPSETERTLDDSLADLYPAS